MAICEECGMEYDISEAKDKFNSIYSMDNDDIIQDNCFDCASSIIESQCDVRECKCCGKRFDVDDADEEFMSETNGMSLKNGNHFNKFLCFECAKKAFEDKEYYDFCEKCGSRFHVGEADLQFADDCIDNNLDRNSRSEISDLILCAKCALEKVLEDN